MCGSCQSAGRPPAGAQQDVMTTSAMLGGEERREKSGQSGQSREERAERRAGGGQTHFPAAAVDCNRCARARIPTWWPPPPPPRQQEIRPAGQMNEVNHPNALQFSGVF